MRTKAAAPITAPGHCSRLARTCAAAYTVSAIIARARDGGNLRHTTDFRRVYASVLERGWQLASERVLQRHFELVRLIS